MCKPPPYFHTSSLDKHPPLNPTAHRHLTTADLARANNENTTHTRNIHTINEIWNVNRYVSLSVLRLERLGTAGTSLPREGPASGISLWAVWFERLEWNGLMSPSLSVQLVTRGVREDVRAGYHLVELWCLCVRDCVWLMPRSTALLWNSEWWKVAEMSSESHRGN